jgi:hypothetical protein
MFKMLIPPTIREAEATAASMSDMIWDEASWAAKISCVLRMEKSSSCAG